VQAGQVRLASVAGVHGANTITHSELNSVHGATSNGTSGGFPWPCPNGQLDRLWEYPTRARSPRTEPRGLL